MYIVAIMITAVIFSVTGMGVLNLASIVNLDTQTAVQTVQDRIEVESFANVALWRLNAGGDTLGTFSSGDLTSSYDTTTMKLTIMKTTEDTQNGLLLNLEEDSHFKRAVATESWIDYSGNTNESADHKLRDDIGFLPQVDLQYFIDNADNEIWLWDEHLHDEDVVEGINVIHGSYIDVHNIDIENATLVFTGYDIQPKDDVRIVAPMVNGVPQPAIILTNEYNNTHFDQGYGDIIHIEGAIYSAAYVRIHEGEFSGPIVAKNVRICRDIDMLDDQYSQYYEWNVGFGNFEDYDWPKQIAEWKAL